MTEAFDVCGPLPSGTVVLEASAGTGKTFTIAALAARYVAAGTPLDQMLLVTFTRMATGELRQRVRDRLVSAEAVLARAGAGIPPPAADTVARTLAAAGPAEIEARRARLAAAVSSFDTATIATTHGFCQHILSGLGVAGDVAEGLTFVDDAADLVEEVVDDLYVRKFAPGRASAPGAGEPAFGRTVALRIGRLAVENPTAPIEPAGAPDDSDRAMRRRLALAVREEVERRKRRAGIVTYDDLLTRLAETLAHPVRGPLARARLRERFHVVLVDEFQDTDPIQWEILRLAFADELPAPAGGALSLFDDPAPPAERPGTTLVLIGDPKQAIYSFRGADVYAYLDAARYADRRATLGVNWRADAGLIDASDALWAGTRLGHDEIVHRPVQAASGHREPRLVGTPDPNPLRIRIVERSDGHVTRTPKGYASAPSTEQHIADDLAGDVVALLAGSGQVIERGPDGTERARAPVRPGDVAVLVRAHRQGAIVQAALASRGVPAALGGAGNVFGSDAARDWLVLLEALERPSSPARAHAVALGPFVGWDAARVAGADDDGWEDVYARLHRWAGVLRRRGVASLLEHISAGEGLPERVLSRAGGERLLTDLRHVGELTHLAAIADGTGTSALAGWLRRRIAEAARADGAGEDRARRLETDADAVQVLTVHRSKGLEFPIVYLPYLWEAGWAVTGDFPVFHDPANDFRRTIDVSAGGRDRAVHQAQHVAELRGEDLRLMYVAMTRARHQAVIWWASSWDSSNSPLGRLLACRDEDGRVPAEGSGVPTEDDVRAWFADIAKRSGGVSVATTAPARGARLDTATTPAGSLRAGRFTRRLDTTWRRTSYSSMTAAVHNGSGAGAGTAPVAHEPEPGETGIDDEEVPEGMLAMATWPAPAVDRPVPLDAMPAGAAVGTLVHEVLETTDFTAPDLDATLAANLAAAQSRSPAAIGDPATVVAGLRAAIETPLGPIAGGLALRDVPRRDRLDELGFELPLAGGDATAGREPVTLTAIGDLLRAHLPAGDPLAAYAERLAAPELTRHVQGFLNGSIDLVLRVPDRRFVIVDYKTNRLGVPGTPLTAGHYEPRALAEVMQRAHYLLQALLYSVALHRYLRWRLAGYDPARNLGGILYLFLRGMTGRSLPHAGDDPYGVFSWRAPSALVPALSDLLDGGEGA